MEEWKKLVYIGIILIILAIAFAILKKTISIWTILIIALAILDIAVGILRKKKG